MDKLIKEFHQLYAKYKRPEYLEIAATLGKVKADVFEEIWESRVNAGCEREGLPTIY